MELQIIKSVITPNLIFHVLHKGKQLFKEGVTLTLLLPMSGF
jgi:hypothetical protein